MDDLTVTSVNPPSGSEIDPETTLIEVITSEDIEAGDSSIEITPSEELTIINVSPPDGSEIDPETTLIEVITSEDIEAGDSSIVIEPDTGSTGSTGSSGVTGKTVTFDVTSPNVSISGNTLIIDLSSNPLSPYTKYRLKFDDGAILSDTGTVISYATFPEFTFTTGA